MVKLAQSDAEAVAADKLALEIAYASGDSASSVTQDVGLPTSGANGTTITWSSDAPGVVGEDGAVVRPSYTTGDASVTLTATIAKGSESATKTFALTVVKLASLPDDSDDRPARDYTEDHVLMSINGSAVAQSLTSYMRYANGVNLLVVHVANEAQLQAALGKFDKPELHFKLDDLSMFQNISLEFSYSMVNWMVEHNVSVQLDTAQGKFHVAMAKLGLTEWTSSNQADASLQPIKVALTLQAVTSEIEEQIQKEAAADSFMIMSEPIEASAAIIRGSEKIALTSFKDYAVLTLPLSNEAAAGEPKTAVYWSEGKGFATQPTNLQGEEAELRTLNGGIFVLISNTASFKDTEGRWSASDVKDMAERLLVEGRSASSFEPTRSMTRAEFATLIVRALALPSASSTSGSFADIPEEAWYANSIAVAAAFGLFKGDVNGDFAPMRLLTRQEAATIIARAQAIMGIASAPTNVEAEEQLDHWRDADSIAAWARQAMAGMIEQGILLGDGNAGIRPEENVSREEMTAMLRRMLQAAGWIN